MNSVESKQIKSSEALLEKQWLWAAMIVWFVGNLDLNNGSDWVILLLLFVWNKSVKPTKTSQMYKFELLMNTMTFKISKITLITLKSFH